MIPPMIIEPSANFSMNQLLDLSSVTPSQNKPNPTAKTTIFSNSSNTHILLLLYVFNIELILFRY